MTEMIEKFIARGKEVESLREENKKLKEESKSFHGKKLGWLLTLGNMQEENDKLQMQLDAALKRIEEMEK